MLLRSWNLLSGHTLSAPLSQAKKSEQHETVDDCIDGACDYQENTLRARKSNWSVKNNGSDDPTRKLWNPQE
jgi:hypothetical protein